MLDGYTRTGSHRVLSADRSTLGLDMATLDQCRTSDVLQRLTSDVQEVTRALEAVTYRGVRSVSSVAAGFISLLFLSKEISVLAVVTVPAATAFFVTLVRLCVCGCEFAAMLVLRGVLHLIALGWGPVAF